MGRAKKRKNLLVRLGVGALVAWLGSGGAFFGVVFGCWCRPEFVLGLR